MHCALNIKLDNHAMYLPLCGVFAILKTKNVSLLFHCKSSIVALSIYICTLFYFKIEKNKKERQGNKKNNLILRKMIIVGLELTILDSRGQCAYHERFTIERVFVLFKGNQYL